MCFCIVLSLQGAVAMASKKTFNVQFVKIIYFHIYETSYTVKNFVVSVPWTPRFVTLNIYPAG